MGNASARRSKRANGKNGVLPPGATQAIEATVETSLVAAPTAFSPSIRPERAGLYSVLGVKPRASSAEVASAYRHLAAKLSTGRERDVRRLRNVNLAYGILGNPARRAEYDQRLGISSETSVNTTWGTPEPRYGPRTGYPSPYHPHKRLPVPGLPELLAVMAVILGTLFTGLVVLDRVQVDLSPVLGAANAVGLGSSARRQPSDAPSARPVVTPTSPGTPTAEPTLADQLKDSSVSVSDPRPARNSPLTVNVKLVRNGQPLADADVWLTAQFRTVKERVPTSGAVKTDKSGAAAITFNLGDATPGFEVKTEVFAQVDGRQTSWQTSFTPR